MDTEDPSTTFSLTARQTRGCVLPRLPLHGTSLSCSYSGRRLLCTLACRGSRVGGQTSCTLGTGAWTPGLLCREGQGRHRREQGRSRRKQGMSRRKQGRNRRKQGRNRRHRREQVRRGRRERLQRLLACRHQANTGCLAPPPLPGSTVSCKVEQGEEVCRVGCGEGRVSPAAYARCETDKSGWEARWSRVLLPCQPTCPLSVPRVAGGEVACRETGEDRMECTLRCGQGRRASLYMDRVEAQQGDTFTCDRGEWSGVLLCVTDEI